MTVITVVAAGNMCRVLAGRNCAIVAGTATSHYLGVIDGQLWHKRIRGVAVFTNVRRLNVCWTLTGCV